MLGYMANSKNYKTVSISREVYDKIMNGKDTTFNRALEEYIGLIVLNLDKGGRPARTVLSENDIRIIVSDSISRYIRSESFDTKLKDVVAGFLNDAAQR